MDSENNLEEPRHSIPLPPPPGGRAISESPEGQPEPSSPPKRSKLPFVLVPAILVGIVLVGLGVASYISAPGRCDNANFRSDRFGYCLVTPAGWTSGEAQVGDAQVDQLLLADGASVFIQAARLGESQDLQLFTDYVRGLAEDQGYTLSPVTTRKVDGVQATVWDVTAGSGTQATKLREVVFIRDGIAWRVQFADIAEQFDGHVGDLGKMLSSWRFI
jgi:hypothetical protein